MPVFSAVITSKRARRGRSSECSGNPLQDSNDLRRLRRKLDEAVTSQKGSSSVKQETHQPYPTSASDIHPAPSSTMSTWQATENSTCNHGVPLSQSNEMNGSNSPPKSPTSKSNIPSGVEKSFQRRRSFSEYSMLASRLFQHYCSSVMNSF